MSEIPTLNEQAECARKTMDALEAGMARIAPVLESIAAEFRRSLEDLERAYGPRPR